jgi:hypothetical protein
MSRHKNIFIFVLILSLSCTQNELEDNRNLLHSDSVSLKSEFDTLTEFNKGRILKSNINIHDTVLISAPLVISDIGVNNLRLGCYLKNITSYDFIVRDTILEEETVWSAKALYFHNELILLAEANWQNDSIISRITVFSEKILTKDLIHVGSKFLDLKYNVSDTIPSSPDGYILLRHKSNKNLFYQFDVDENNKIYLGISSLNEIPSDMKVRYILIM